MIHALAPLLLAASAAAPAAPAKSATPAVRYERAAPERAPVPILNGEDVARLCRALEPGERLRPTGDAVARGEAQAQHGTDRAAALKERYVARVPADKLAFA